MKTGSDQSKLDERKTFGTVRIGFHADPVMFRRKKLGKESSDYGSELVELTIRNLCINDPK